MTFGSLFAGIGGFDLGLERAGMECRWQVEIDEAATETLSTHWPNVDLYSDVTKIQEGQLERVDLICGGFPCQPWSIAGKKKRKSDDRWLWPDFARIIRMVGPRYVIVENVPGLRDGGGLDAVLGEIADLGFDAEWETISASEFGAPHERARVFIVAYSKRKGLSGLLSREGFLRIRRSTHAEFGNRGFDVWGWWEENRANLRMGDGLPVSVARRACKAFGNAVVPQVVEWIGRRIVEFDSIEPRRESAERGR